MPTCPALQRLGWIQFHTTLHTWLLCAAAGVLIFVMLLFQVLALHSLILLPALGRNQSSWNEPHNDTHVWYQSLQAAGERFEDHILAINLLLQTFDKGLEEQLGAFDKLLSDDIKILWEWLEDHTMNLSVWLSMYFWTLQEFHDRYIKETDYILGRDLLLHDSCWDEHMNTAGKDPNITLYTWLEEAPVVFRRALESKANEVGSSMEEYIEIQTQRLEDHVKILEELLDHYIATTSKWLEAYATIKKSTWNLLHAAPLGEKLASTKEIVFRRRPRSVVKWLEECIDALEQWLWDTICQQEN